MTELEEIMADPDRKYAYLMEQAGRKLDEHAQKMKEHRERYLEYQRLYGLVLDAGGNITHMAVPDLALREDVEQWAKWWWRRRAELLAERGEIQRKELGSIERPPVQKVEVH